MEFVLSWGNQIASGGAWIAAVISIVIAFRMASYRARLDYEVQTRVAEHLANLGLQSQAQTDQRQELRARIETLLTASGALQGLKDSVYAVLQASEQAGTVPREDVISQIRDAKQRLESLYQDSVGSLEEAEKALVHPSKARALHVQGIVTRALGQSEYMPQLSAEDAAALRDALNRFSEAQGGLRDVTHRRQLELTNASTNALITLDR